MSAKKSIPIPHRVQDLRNFRFGRLLVIAHAGKRKGNRQWVCRCDCGVEKTVASGNLKNGSSKSCGCLRIEMISGESSSKWTGCGELTGSYWYSLKVDATKRGHAFRVTQKFVWELFLKQNRRCALSGLPLMMQGCRRYAGTASLDRIDSEKGYVKSNVQWVHMDVNRMKSTFDEQYFVSMCKQIVQHQKVYADGKNRGK